MKKPFSKLTALIYLLVFTVGFGIGVLSSTHDFRLRPTTSSKLDTLSFQDSVLNYIYQLRLEHPYIVYAKAVIESGNFTSTIFKENNNLFGMKMPESRATLAIRINRGHSVYRSWKESIIDYGLYQMAYAKGLSEDDYFKKIGNNYSEDKMYIQKVKAIKSQK